MIVKVAVANLEFGGLGRTSGDDSRLHLTTNQLARWRPDVILIQELMGRQPYDLQRHARRIAAMVGNYQVIVGDLMPQSASGNHTAVFVRNGLEVVDSGPPDTLPGLPWCEVLVKVPGWPFLILFVSMHMPARSGTLQRIYSETLGSHLMNTRRQSGTESLAAGDANSYPPDPELTSDQLFGLPEHLRSARLCPGPDGTALLNSVVYDQLVWNGLTEIAGALPPELRDPPELRPTGATGVGREMHGYVTPGVVPALAGYTQRQPGGSDHAVLLYTLQQPG